MEKNMENNGQVLCAVCGEELKGPEKAFLPHLRVIAEALGREVMSDDLPRFAICGKCGMTIRALKFPDGEEYRGRTYSYSRSCGILKHTEWLKRQEQREERARKAGEFVGARQAPVTATIGEVVMIKSRAKKTG